MEVLWRDDEYEFNPRAIEGGTDNLTKFSNIDGLIFGADTESVQLKDRYEVQCFTLSSLWDDHLEYVPEKDFVFKTLMTFFLETYEEKLFNHSVNHHLMYYHNLEYDWLQMIKTDPRLLELAKIGVSPEEEIKLFTLGNGFHVSLKKNALFAGSAPHMKLRIKKGRQAFTLYIHDTFSFFPSSLDNLAKDLKLGIEKLERQETLGQIDFRSIPNDSTEKIYFETYSKIDSKVTRMAGEKIRDLHKVARMTKIRASAPAYAISLLYHMMSEDQSIVTGTHDQTIMQLILNTYRGGRTGGIFHGKVEGISVLDFHSSYPASMLSLPSFSPDMAYIRLEGEELQLENVIEILQETGNAFLTISGTETDSKYPSLLTSFNGKLTPVNGDFERVSTTGYEFYVGVKSGGLTNLVIHECVVLLDMEEDQYLPFRVFAQTAYERKNNSKKGSVEYASAKLALNAAYGKLIESRTQTLIGASDSRDYLPYIDGMEKEFGNFYYSEYVKAFEDGKRLGDIYESLLDQLHGNFDEETLEDMPVKMFGDFSISGKIYGRYVTPAGASLITGCSRARLLVAMKALNAFYWDTDSVFVPAVESEEEVNEKLAHTIFWLPSNTVPVRIGDELGELDIEMLRGNGFLAGTKRYYLKEVTGLDAEGNEEWNIKRATHGIPALQREKIPTVIESLATGRNYTYESKGRPQKAKESKRMEDIGSFQSSAYTCQFHLDERLDWVSAPNGWIGTVRPFDQMGIKKHFSNEEYEQFSFKLEEMKNV